MTSEPNDNTPNSAHGFTEMRHIKSRLQGIIDCSYSPEEAEQDIGLLIDDIRATIEHFSGPDAA